MLTIEQGRIKQIRDQDFNILPANFFKLYLLNVLFLIFLLFVGY